MDERPVQTGPAPAPADAARPGRYETPAQQQESERRTQRVLLRVLRLLFLVLLTTVTVLSMASRSTTAEVFDLTTVTWLFIGSLAVGVIVIVVDTMSPHKRLSTVVAMYLGLCAGLIGALAIGALLDAVARAWGLEEGTAGAMVGTIKVAIGIILCYLGVSVVLTTKDDFRLVIPYVEFAKQVRGVRPLLLDSSVLIDGRIEMVGQTGFIDAPLIVPQFVIDELQLLADSSDKLKRERGRRGLNVVSKIQASPFVDVSIDDTEVEARSVDHMLLDLASRQSLRVLTNDTNLSKVAQIRGVTVLNLNDLASTLKSQVVPGQALTLQIIKPGEGPSQGVGYLADGTMVVVEDGLTRLGQNVTITVTNSLQTAAGRMIFGRLDNGEPQEPAAPGGVAGTPGVAESMARAATHQPRVPVRPSAPREEPHSGRNPRR